MNKTVYRYEPDYVVAPGEILEDTLLARRMKKVELAERCGLSAKQMSLIIAGKTPLTPETSIHFERILGISANIWNNLEGKFRLFQAQKKDREELEKYEDWLKRFPARELKRRGIIKRDGDVAKQVAELLRFFNVGSVSSWEERYRNLQVSFRRSTVFKNSFEAAATWLRIAELKAEDMNCRAFDKTKFDAALDNIRNLSCESPEVFEPEMKQLCAGAGVALVFVSELQGTHLSGAVRWLRSDKAMIALSLRYKTDDQLWFTFFHEAGHLKLHGKKEIFIDEADQSELSEEEKEANQFAANQLIPRKAYIALRGFREYTESNLREFAITFGIAPGIALGRLQHDGLVSWKTSLNNLKCHFKLVE